MPHDRVVHDVIAGAAQALNREGRLRLVSGEGEVTEQSHVARAVSRAGRLVVTSETKLVTLFPQQSGAFSAVGFVTAATPEQWNGAVYVLAGGGLLIGVAADALAAPC